MSTQPDYSTGWILEYVRESFQGRSAYSEITFEEYIERLWQTLERAGVPSIQKKKQAGYDGTYYAVTDAPDQIRHSALQAINYLLVSGLLVSIPTTSIVPWRKKDNSYILTKSGAEWATGKDPLPEDSARYMALLKSLVNPLDPVIDQYLSGGRPHQSLAPLLVVLRRQKMGCIRQVDATPSDVSLLCKGGVGMRLGQRFGLSAIEKREVWSRWKAGQSLHEIGRAFDKPHCCIRGRRQRGKIPGAPETRTR
jgi:hypothetical protein